MIHLSRVTDTRYVICNIRFCLWTKLDYWMLMFSFHRYKKREESRQMYLVHDSRDVYMASSHTLKHLIDQSSGSGSGLPLLVS